MSLAEFKVSTRSAFLTAVTSVASSGLALAAVATGAVAMPLNEPAPSFGTAEQPGPNTPDIVLFIVPDSVMESEPAIEELEVIEGELEDDEDVEDVEDVEESLLQADRPRGRAIARAMRPARAVDFFMRGAPCWPAVGWEDSPSFPEGPAMAPRPHSTVTAISWIPLDPSGNGVARSLVWRTPVRSRARTARRCTPGVASHGRYHCRQ